MFNPSLCRFSGVPIRKADVSVFRIPTADEPESDGTAVWSHTTMVLVQITAGDHTGLGYTYASAAAARVIQDDLLETLKGQDAMDIPSIWHDMLVRIRNFGRPGLISMAIAAVDNALWDLKARLLDTSIIKLLGAVREEIPIYASGGFTSYGVEQLERQLGGWAEQGIREVKMKVGRSPDQDLERVRAVRRAIGKEVGLYVDANGAYGRKQALALAEGFAELGVRWLEEPVSSDDLEGLRLIRDRVPPTLEVAAGEYGYDAAYFQRMVVSGAVVPDHNI